MSSDALDSAYGRNVLQNSKCILSCQNVDWLAFGARHNYPDQETFMYAWMGEVYPTDPQSHCHQQGSLQVIWSMGEHIMSELLFYMGIYPMDFSEVKIEQHVN